MMAGVNIRRKGSFASGIKIDIKTTFSCDFCQLNTLNSNRTSSLLQIKRIFSLI